MNLRDGINKLKEHATLLDHIRNENGEQGFNRYANLDGFYKILDDIDEENEPIKQVYDMDDYVGTYYPRTKDFQAYEYYDEVEPRTNEDKMRYYNRLLNLGYEPSKVDNLIKSYKWRR